MISTTIMPWQPPSTNRPLRHNLDHIANHWLPALYMILLQSPPTLLWRNWLQSYPLRSHYHIAIPQSHHNIPESLFAKSLYNIHCLGTFGINQDVLSIHFVQMQPRPLALKAQRKGLLFWNDNKNPMGSMLGVLAAWLAFSCRNDKQTSSGKCEELLKNLLRTSSHFNMTSILVWSSTVNVGDFRKNDNLISVTLKGLLMWYCYFKWLIMASLVEHGSLLRGGNKNKKWQRIELESQAEYFVWRH